MYKVVNSLLTLVILCIIISCLPSNNDIDSPEFEDAIALVEAAKTRVSEMEVSEFKALMDQEEYFILIDVRTEKEHNSSYIPGSVLIPRGVLEFRISSESFWDDEGMYLPEKADQLIIYCKSGNRSALAADALRTLGFENVFTLKGGLRSWKETYPDMIEKNEAPLLIIPSVAGEEDDGGSC